MSVNWQSIVANLPSLGVLASSGFLGAGVVVALVEGFIRNPERRANVTKVYTEAGVELLRQCQAANKELEKSNKRLLQSNENLLASNDKLDQTFREFKVTVLLLIDAAERVIPMLQVETNSVDVMSLTTALGSVRRTLNGHA